MRFASFKTNNSPLPALLREGKGRDNLMKNIFLSIIALLCITTLSAEETLRIEFITPSIVRVTASIYPGYPSNETGCCIYQKQPVNVKQTDTDNETRYESSDLIVLVDKQTQQVRFMDKAGNVILNQGTISHSPSYQERVIYDEKSAHVEETANGKVTVKDVIRRDTIGRSTRYVTTFYNADEKALYGLGAHMEDYMNLQGKTMYLTQHNLKVTVPLLLSTAGYGLLFDAGCAMTFKSEEATEECAGDCHGYVTTMQLEAAKSLDYYFMYGGSTYAEKPFSASGSLPRECGGRGLGSIVRAYHYLTGNVSMMPRYLFGYTQSKERYVSSDDIINTLREYRRRHVPIDMIVQDWNYWPQGWGYMKMNRKYYPSPKALADSVHAMNAKLMVSIWANPQWCPEADDFKQRGMMLEHDVYDAFNPEARKLYWNYANDEFFSQGFDAWWCDSSEPLDGDWNKIPANSLEGEGRKYGWDDHAYRYQLNKDVLSEALGAERSNLYSLYHAMGIYENQRKQMREGQEKRVVNLTRSSYAGQQRYGTIVWNGDTHASWKSFRQQIPAGLNYMATGNPYWTVDIGSFFTRNDGRRWFYAGEFPQGVKDDNYKEYYTRMFQWATFLPMLRSHGSDTPREIWHFITDEEKAGNTSLADCKYAGAILKMINLRYQHTPYIYSMAAAQSGLTTTPIPSFGHYTPKERDKHAGYLMARMLSFDYATDANVLDIKDEYMFGDFLVCPVTHPLSETTVRKVYLPKGDTWKDYWTGRQYDGGQWIDCQSEIGTIPLFVRSGSIIPTTEVAEYSDAQFGKPVTINIHPGKDAQFSLYEDEGDNYNYEHGAYTIIPLSWNESRHTLTIGKREGSYDGMLKSRTFIVGTPEGKKTVTYKGKKLSVRF